MKEKIDVLSIWSGIILILSGILVLFYNLIWGSILLFFGIFTLVTLRKQEHIESIRSTKKTKKKR
ncbi:hypothetical protein CXT76_00585 [Candidatus Parvarchaeota archaeon]|jgi:hypothetical protein|nr:MAG: hypothetical protein CXX78_01995 [Candidatus Parvarchaeota archaeon]RZD31281.1 MAG: hypothetical protein CXT76_00585 [Candidatus Parvarchaeota archaeon]HIG51979.1 hypothetical protein [Candidatus Pacearchaeota archaeon]